jgi:predicted transcriptional regulator
MSSAKKQISGAQIKAARGLLHLHQSDLAEIVGLTREGIARIETGKVKPRRSNLERIAAALEERGIEFINGRGVLLNKPGHSSAADHETAGE